MVLNRLINLRSLTLTGINVKLDFKLLFSQMGSLSSLSINFEDD
jgi:hypothetical protein